MPTPKHTKAHSLIRAQELLELGWTLKHELKTEQGDIYEWYFAWEHMQEPGSSAPLGQETGTSEFQAHRKMGSD